GGVTPGTPAWRRCSRTTTPQPARARCRSPGMPPSAELSLRRRSLCASTCGSEPFPCSVFEDGEYHAEDGDRCHRQGYGDDETALFPADRRCRWRQRREVAGDGGQVTMGRGLVDPSNPVGEFVECEPAGGGVAFQLSRHSSTILVGGSHARVCHGAHVSV